MLGFPSETRDEIEQTIQFACKSRLLVANFFNVVPFPRTEMFELARKTYPDFDFGYDAAPNMFYWTTKPYFNEVEGIDIMELRKYALQKFYMNPRRLWNEMRMMPITWHMVRSFMYGIAYWLIRFGRSEEEPTVQRQVDS